MTFRHGVASGDPLPERTLLWTRCTPPPGRAPEAIAVGWQVAATPDLRQVIAEGTAVAAAEHDYTVKVDVGGLEPATTYHYRFTAAGGAVSPVGRTRTAPRAGAESLRIAVVSCGAWPGGYFNAYRCLAGRDLDLVVHLGDYIYEDGRHAGRGPRAHHPPGTVASLGGYRARYAQYRSDPDLAALHARHPMVAVWDDHELAGGAWSDGAVAHLPRRHGRWADRRAAAVRAYLEWMPVRPPDPAAGDRIYRRTGWGGLADLLVLDTRLVGRDRPVSPRVVVRVRDRRRSLLGDAQRGWLAGELAGPQARWRLVASGVMVAPVALVAGRLVNTGQWDGYPAERDRLYDLLAAAGGNAVVLSGDIHSSWAAELPVGAELVVPSVTSPSFASILLPPVPGVASLAAALFRRQNRHLRLVELARHGYVVVDVTPERVQGDWWHLDTVRRRSQAERWRGGWQLRWGRPGLVPAPAPAPPRPC